MTGCADGTKAAKSSEKKSLHDASKILCARTVLPPALRVTSVNRDESSNPGNDDANDAFNKIISFSLDYCTCICISKSLKNERNVNFRNNKIKQKSFENFLSKYCIRIIFLETI